MSVARIGTTRLLFDTQRRRHGLRHQLGAGYGCQLHQPDTLGVALQQAIGYLEREAGLAAPTRAGQRQQPCLLQQLP